MEPKEVFESTTLSIWRVMQEPNRGLYIPAYQRPYAWQKDMAKTLLGSICEGITWLQTDEAAVTVLGTLIFVLDTQKATVEPAVKGELPASVFLVIDGQQRLSTLAILVVILDEKLRLAQRRLPKDEDVNRWAGRSLSILQKRLQDMIAFDRGFGDDSVLRHFPRIIRAFDDSWSTYGKEARYASPIASFLHAYVKHLKGTGNTADKFVWTPGEGEQAKVVNDVYKALARLMDRLVEDRHDDEEDPPLPSLADICSQPALHERFFDGGIPAEVAAFLGAPVIDRATERVQVLARTMMIARYLLDRVAVTQVEVKREAYAFDLFESLNTTGDPLTAYETFKPHVIRDEKLENYKTSASFRHMEDVDRYFNENASRRARATHELLIPFASFEKGEKLGKQLREQRNWLRRNYDELGPGAPRHEFLRGMATVARFMTDCWQDASTAATFVPNDCLPDFRFCLAVLRSANHEITIALLARVFEGVHTGLTEAERHAAGRELTETLRAVTAFFGFWRGSREGTKNIDSVHRKLLSDTERGFRRRGGTRPTGATVRAALRTALLADGVGGISGREEWVNKASALGVYEQSTDLTRLLLLAAGHDAVPDPDDAGLLKGAKAGVCATLTEEAWEAGHEVEHIAPANPSGDPAHHWSRSIYDDDRLHTLGNLWLLPSRENKSASNRGWPVKRMFYRALAAKTEAEANAILAEPALAQAGINKVTEVILANANYLQHIHALAALPADHKWDADYVERRSRNIASMAWDTLAPWLGLGT